MQSGVRSKVMFQRASNVIPCGVNSNFRYWGDDKTLMLKKGQGGYIWDQDDNRYIDYRLGFGPVILGHGFKPVTDRIKEVLEMGNTFAMTSEYEVSVAEKIHKLTGVDMVRLANTGTEATMHAIRIARAYTGRDKILKFEGHYHGFHDTTLWNCYPPIPGAGYRRSPVLVAHGSGIPMKLSELVISVPFNDRELLENRVKENWGDIACIIMEPLMGNTASIMPDEGFLDFVRDLCDEYGIKLIIDEVKTGFRIAKGGAQEYFGIKADLVTYAKALGNGFPVAAIGGKRDIMSEIAPGKIPLGGTYTGNAVAVAAADATLDAIEDGALDAVESHGKKLMEGIKKLLMQYDVPSLVQGPPSMFGIVLTGKDRVSEYRDWAVSDHDTYEKIILSLFEKGVMPDKDSREPWFISASHTDGDAAFVLQAFEDSLKEVLGK
ncbi:MAG: aspartate aminotransferase family protein [Spirochaetes bacterium]|nr:MAG: aspartate aminotransferase family protein [Spirochaetota bacterium]